MLKILEGTSERIFESFMSVLFMFKGVCLREEFKITPLQGCHGRRRGPGARAFISGPKIEGCKVPSLRPIGQAKRREGFG